MELKEHSDFRRVCITEILNADDILCEIFILQDIIDCAESDFITLTEEQAKEVIRVCKQKLRYGYCTLDIDLIGSVIRDLYEEEETE